MKHVKYILLAAIIPAAACKKNTQEVYKADQPYVNIWLGTSAMKEDSVIYNFGLKPERDVDSILFTARLMGLINSNDRSFRLKAIGGDTDRIREGVHYRFGAYTLKANTYQAILPVYILRTGDFKDTTFRIIFGVDNTGELPAGVKERSNLLVLLRDKFQKPGNWDAETSSAYTRLSSFFGSFSKAKFQFITTTTGVAPTYRVRYVGTAVPPDEVPYTQAQYYSSKCKTALSSYNATHPTPLVDENGQVITF